MLISGIVDADGFQTALEIGKCFDISSLALPRRNGVDLASGPKMPDGAREETLRRTDAEQRHMRDVMPDTDRYSAHFIDEKRAQVNVRHDEYGTRYVVVEAAAKFSEHPYAAALFICGQHEETGEQDKRGEDRNNGHHGT